MKSTVGEEMEGRGSGGRGGGSQSFSNKWGHIYMKKGWKRGRGNKRAEIRKKERLVMSMLSVTSFVDSHCVVMATVKSLLQKQ